MSGEIRSAKRERARLAQGILLLQGGVASRRAFGSEGLRRFQLDVRESVALMCWILDSKSGWGAVVAAMRSALRAAGSATPGLCLRKMLAVPSACVTCPAQQLGRCKGQWVTFCRRKQRPTLQQLPQPAPQQSRVCLRADQSRLRPVTAGSGFSAAASSPHCCRLCPRRTSCRRPC